MKFSALVDASSAILLYKAGVFDLLAEAYRLSMVPSVYREICVPDRAGAEYFTRAHRQGLLSLVSPDPTACGPEVPGNHHLGDGERQTLLAYSQGMAAFVILDDRRAAQFCQESAIPFINALLAVKILNLSGYLPDPDHGRVSSEIVRVGYYSRWVIRYAADFSHLMLDRFHRRIGETAPRLSPKHGSLLEPVSDTASR
jgi:hypothetical protein